MTKEGVPINYDAGNNELESTSGFYCSGPNPAIDYSKNLAFKQALITSNQNDLKLRKESAIVVIKKMIQWPTDNKDPFWYTSTAAKIASHPEASIFFDSIKSGTYGGTDRQQMYTLLDCPDYSRKYVDVMKFYTAIKTVVLVDK